MMTKHITLAANSALSHIDTSLLCKISIKHMDFIIRRSQLQQEITIRESGCANRGKPHHSDRPYVTPDVSVLSDHRGSLLLGGLHVLLGLLVHLGILFLVRGRLLKLVDDLGNGIKDL